MFKYLSFQRIVSSTLSILLFTLAALAGENPGSRKRIELKPGVPMALNGEVGPNQEEIYVFSAKAGQKFSGRITKKDGNTGFSVTGPDDDAIPEEEYDFNLSLKSTLDKTGDYKIIVTTFEKRASKYTLTVSLH
jgi:hypothetical protein